MESTQDLTSAVLRVDDYTRHTDGSFVRAAPHLGACGWSETKPLLRSLLQTVKDQCQHYFDAQRNRREVNYEDLFFAMSQLEEHLSEEYENPAIQPFTEVVMKGIRTVHERMKLAQLVDDAGNYIRDVVALQLCRSPKSRDHLTCLVEAMSDQAFEGCDIFTLNHDLLIESVLNSKELCFVDGFGVPDGDVAWWEPEVFARPSRHYFLKLHGSINWVQYDGRLAKALSIDRAHSRTAGGRMLGLPDHAVLLIGTFNKIRDYFKTPYFDLQATFRRQMSKIDCLMVSGYSFGDKGVNAVLSEWMHESAESKLIVLHADGDRCLERGRGAIWKLWERYARTRRMLTFPSYLNNTSWGILRRDHKIGVE
ncbi:MAG: SIR2 family protein [Acidobacteria bacterium]|nr:SIR2 family protein [Acidobacteriota bacterium]